MRRFLYVPYAALTVLALFSAQAAEKPEDGLPKGVLKERIEVQELQGGFAGFTGVYYAVEPDGSWSTGPVLPGDKKGAPQAKGILSAEHLSKLAKDLAGYDPGNLPSHGKPVVNPRETKIVFGKRASQLIQLRGEEPTKEDLAIQERYDGVGKTVKAACRPAEK